MKLHEYMLLGASLCKLEAGDWNHCILGVAGTAAGIPTWGNESKGRDKVIYNKWKFLNIISSHSGHFIEKQIMVDIFGNQYESYFPYFAKTYIGRFIWECFDNEVCRGQNTLESLIDYTKNLEMIYDNQKCLPLPITVSGVENHEFIEETVSA